MRRPRPVNDLRFLLVQIRKDPDVLAPERAGFIELSGLAGRQVTTLDVYRQPQFSPSILEEYDALMIGGLSDDPSDSLQLPRERFPFLENLQMLIRQAVHLKKPSLLSCGGFMIASEILGASVVIDPAREELGVYTITLTEGSRRDPLFIGFPRSFKAVSGHIKSTLTTPPGCTLLASSERCPVHAFTVEGAPFYAFQFHPEIRCEQLQARVERYREKYFKTEAEYRRFIALMDDTSVANSIIRRFVELVGVLT
jgi:GMP synthase (glutamine-hydrolysing)